MRQLRHGFSLVEVMMSIVLTLLLLGALYRFLVPSVSLFETKTFSYQSTDYPAAPSLSALEAALKLHAEFNALLEAASAAYVFGGRNEDPNSPGDYGLPLDWDYSPGAGLAAVADVANLRDILGIKSEWAGMLEYDSVSGTSQFSVLLMGNATTPVALAQVRRAEDSGRAFYEVLLRYGSSLSENLSYRYTIGLSQDQWTQPVDAINQWFRYDSPWQRYDQGPSITIFPDPYQLAIEHGGGETAPVSRFIYSFAPVNDL